MTGGRVFPAEHQDGGNQHLPTRQPMRSGRQLHGSLPGGRDEAAAEYGVAKENTFSAGGNFPLRLVTETGRQPIAGWQKGTHIGPAEKFHTDWWPPPQLGLAETAPQNVNPCRQLHKSLLDGRDRVATDYGGRKREYTLGRRKSITRNGGPNDLVFAPDSVLERVE
jgi:hypothetical protein